VADLVRALPERDRRNLARVGVRLGVEHVYALPMLAGAREHGVLWRVFRGEEGPGWHRVRGTPLVGGVPVRVDVLEAFAARAREGARHGAFVVPEGLPPGEAEQVLAGLGYVPAGERWARGRTSRMRA
jgi:hypothetical protein